MGLCQAKQPTTIQTEASDDDELHIPTAHVSETIDSEQTVTRSVHSNLSKEQSSIIAQCIHLILDVKYTKYEQLFDNNKMKNLQNEWKVNDINFFDAERRFKERLMENNKYSSKTYENVIRYYINKKCTDIFASVCDEKNDFISSNISKPFKMNTFLSGFIHFSISITYNFDINILNICKMYIGPTVNVNENIIKLCHQIFHSFYPIQKMGIIDKYENIVFPSKYFKQCLTYSFINHFIMKHLDISQISMYFALFLHDIILKGFEKPYSNKEDDEFIFYKINCLFKELIKHENGYNGSCIVQKTFELHRVFQFIRLNEYFNHNIFEWEWNVTCIPFTRLSIYWGNSRSLQHDGSLQSRLKEMGQLITRYQMLYLFENKTQEEIREFVYNNNAYLKNIIRINSTLSTEYENVYELNVDSVEYKVFLEAKENYSPLKIQKEIIDIMTDSELPYYSNYKIKKLWKGDEKIMNNKNNNNNNNNKLDEIVNKIYKRLLHSQTICGVVHNPQTLILQCIANYVKKTDNVRVQNYCKDMSI